MRRTLTYLFLACLAVGPVLAENAETADARATRWLTNRQDVASWKMLVEKWDASKAALTSPIENLTLPVAHYADGRKRIVLVARRAQILSETLIFAEGVQLQMLTPDGKSDGIVLAEDCLLDQSTKRGYCKGTVTVTKGTDRINGRGLLFAGDDQFIKILSECQIRTFRMPAKFGRLS